MVTTDKVQGMQRKVVLVTVGVIALAVVAAKLFAPSYVTSLRQSRELTRRQTFLGCVLSLVSTRWTRIGGPAHSTIL